jgi:hypothetical protein
MNMRYLIGFLGVIAIIILIIVLFVRGGGGPEKPAIDLADYTTSTSEVAFINDGPVSATQTHDVVKITVNQSEATINVIKGYEGQVVASRSYPMNANAYAAFLLSLKHAGYTIGNDDADLKDERGYCPTGDRYVYELNDNGGQVSRYWNTSCGNRYGTFQGQGPLVRQLFQMQIPDYNELTNTLTLQS